VEGRDAALEFLGEHQGGDHVGRDRHGAGAIEQDHQHGGYARFSSAA
jgi:hypothetical protein